MYKTEFFSESVLNPYSVYVIGPFEEMNFRNMDSIIMQELADLMPQGERKKDLQKQIQKGTHWCDLG